MEAFRKRSLEARSTVLHEKASASKEGSPDTRQTSPITKKRTPVSMERFGNSLGGVGCAAFREKPMGRKSRGRPKRSALPYGRLGLQGGESIVSAGSGRIAGCTKSEKRMGKEGDAGLGSMGNRLVTSKIENSRRA